MHQVVKKKKTIRNKDVSCKAETHHLFYLSLVSPASTFCQNNRQPNTCHRTVWKTLLQSTQPCNPPPAPKIYFDNILPSSKMAIPLNLSKTKYHTFQSLCPPWITPIIKYQKYKTQSYLLCHCIYLSGPNILLDTSFSQPLNCITPSHKILLQS